MKYLNEMLKWNKENDYLINQDIKKQIQKQIRIHKKYIYRLDRVEQFIDFTEENFMLTTGDLKPISQTRLDEFSMQGLKKVVRYSLNNIGDYEHEIFDYFQDERGTRYKRTVWERDTKTNKIILEGVVANGI